MFTKASCQFDCYSCPIVRQSRTVKDMMLVCSGFAPIRSKGFLQVRVGRLVTLSGNRYRVTTHVLHRYDTCFVILININAACS